MKQIILSLIRFYQFTLSPDHGWPKILYPTGYCKFSPSCSEYCYQSIVHHGLFSGSWLGFRRILRCNPRNIGGFDPISKSSN